MQAIHDASKRFTGAPADPLVDVVKQKFEQAPSVAHEQQLAEQALTHIKDVCGSAHATEKYRRW